MDKCECWEEVKYPVYGYNAICLGTKEKEYCSCNGDVSKCSFYPEKRKENNFMLTPEMWTQAQENGKTYQLMNEKVKIYYRKDRGIFDSDGYHVSISRLGEIGTFMNRHWQETTPVLTKTEAEVKFGIKIIGD